MFSKNTLADAIRKALLIGIPTLVLAACSGDDGKDGADGSDGANGSDGAAGVDGANGVDGADGKDGVDGSFGGSLTRLATVPLGAEVTGAYVTENGDLFFNVQHPDNSNTEADANGIVFDHGTVGVLKGVNINQLPQNLISVGVPQSDWEKQTVQVAYGEYQVIAQTTDTFGGAMAQG